MALRLAGQMVGLSKPIQAKGDINMTIQEMQRTDELRNAQSLQQGVGGPRYDRREGNEWQQNRFSNGNGGQQSGFLDGNAQPLSKALGWFSIGLGLAQLAAPERVAEWIGIRPDEDTQAVVRAVGVREIASGIGILTQAQPVGWVKARVGGDVMDLTLLGGALSSDRARQDRVAIALAAVAGITALDMLCTQQLTQQQDQQQSNGQSFRNAQLGGSTGAMTAMAPQASGNIHVKKSLTVNRSPEELYQFWHNFEHLPQFMTHLESVQVMGERQSHWKAKAPLGMTVEWDAEIIDDQPNELIAWRAVENADVKNAGSVRFQRAPGGRGTMVTVELQYDPPGGVIAATIAKLFGEDPQQQVSDDLRIFKQVMETGEIVRSDGSLWGPTLKQRPAQPPTAEELTGD